jgi:hypothetical protein
VPAQVVSTRLLKIGDDYEVNKYYTQKFNDLQQTVCKIIAKAFVKCIEPRKQTNHPYRGGPGNAPAWWPSVPKSGENCDGVRHKEPDHLYKRGKRLSGPRWY